jgi:putative acetyltransferase
MAQKEPMPPPKHLHIRDAVDADGPSLALLIARVFAEYAGVRFLAEEFPELEAPASHYASRAGRLMVGEDDGRILASFAIVPTHVPGVAEFLKVYVDRSLRGQGVARRLLDLALAEARAGGATAISLWSDLKFVEGHRFYLRNGFQRGAGVRALHDACETLEINFRLDPIPAGLRS